MAILTNNYNISKKIELELKKVRKQYANKIARVNKNNEYGNLYVPERPKTVKEIKASVKNGYEVRAEIRRMQNYLKKNAEKQSLKNENLSNYEYEELNRLKRKSMKKLNEEIKFYESTDLKTLGKTTGNTLRQMGDTTIEAKIDTFKEIKALKISKLKDPEEIKDVYKMLARQSKKTTKLDKMKENYITMLDTLGRQAGVSQEARLNIADRVVGLSAKDFYNLYISDTSVKILMEQYDIYRDKIKKGRKYTTADKSRDREYFNALNSELDNVFK